MFESTGISNPPYSEGNQVISAVSVKQDQSNTSVPNVETSQSEVKSTDITKETKVRPVNYRRSKNHRANGDNELDPNLQSDKDNKFVTTDKNFENLEPPSNKLNYETFSPSLLKHGPKIKDFDLILKDMQIVLRRYEVVISDQWKSLKHEWVLVSRHFSHVLNFGSLVNEAIDLTSQDKLVEALRLVDHKSVVAACRVFIKDLVHLVETGKEFNKFQIINKNYKIQGVHLIQF